ncbi:MAG: 4-carboxymuconolactone decarboxylase, partial [Colwellia sp.]
MTTKKQNESYLKGEKIRREVMSDEFVDRALHNAN